MPPTAETAAATTPTPGNSGGRRVIVLQLTPPEPTPWRATPQILQASFVRLRARIAGTSARRRVQQDSEPWLAAAQRQGRSEFGRLPGARLVPGVLQISARFVLSPTGSFSNIAQNLWTRPRNDAASYSSFSQKISGPVAAFFSHDS